MTWIGRSVLDTLRAREMTVCGCYRARRLPLRRHRNPGAVAAAHQHAVLGLAQIGDADRKPDADRGQRDGEGEGRNVCQHAMAKVVRVVPIPLVARQIVRPAPAVVWFICVARFFSFAICPSTRAS